MSNKTSDKNVANIEIVIKDCREHLKLYGEAFITASELDRIENILAELEQKDKRIKELEDENKKFKVGFNQQVEILNNTIKELNNSIPKQVVIDLIKNETIDISGFECIAVEDLEKIIGG